MEGRRREPRGDLAEGRCEEKGEREAARCKAERQAGDEPGGRESETAAGEAQRRRAAVGRQNGQRRKRGDREPRPARRRPRRARRQGREERGQEDEERERRPVVDEARGAQAEKVPRPQPRGEVRQDDRAGSGDARRKQQRRGARHPPRERQRQEKGRAERQRELAEGVKGQVRPRAPGQGGGGEGKEGRRRDAERRPRSGPETVSKHRAAALGEDRREGETGGCREEKGSRAVGERHSEGQRGRERRPTRSGAGRRREAVALRAWEGRRLSWGGKRHAPPFRRERWRGEAPGGRARWAARDAVGRARPLKLVAALAQLGAHAHHHVLRDLLRPGLHFRDHPLDDHGLARQVLRSGRPLEEGGDLLQLALAS